MLTGTTHNQDLVWSLGGKKFSEATFGFLKRFESALCLFSSTVSQLYSNYEIVHFGYQGTKLVALPNAYAAHDTFNNVNGEAIEATGLYILPSEVTMPCDQRGLRLFYRCGKTGLPRSLPLAEGLERVKARYVPHEPFLPVMINRDLQTFRGGIPAMHLHRLKIDKLMSLSELEKTDIRNTVADKMRALF